MRVVSFYLFITAFALISCVRLVQSLVLLQGVGAPAGSGPFCPGLYFFYPACCAVRFIVPCLLCVSFSNALDK